MTLPEPGQGDPGGPHSMDPLPNRFTRATALGCVGILGVLALPIFLLVVALADWHLAPWLLQLLELVVFAAMAGGIWLLARVPGGGAAQGGQGGEGRDPRRPLTRAGRAPLIERPADAANRRSLLAVTLLALGMMAVYVVASSLAGKREYGLVVALAGLLGAACLALGVGIALGGVPVPAWRWVRTPVAARVLPQGIATSLLGAAALGWSLLAAAGAGYTWGAAGLALLLLVSVLLTPLARRWPSSPRGRTGASWTAEGSAAADDGRGDGGG